MGSPVERSRNLAIGGKSLPLPAFIPSVSTIRTKAPIRDCIAILVRCGSPLLLSAYDLAYCTPEDRENIQRLLAEHHSSGGGIFLDSGTYESQWSRGDVWNAEYCAKIVATTPHDYRFNFDRHDPPDAVGPIVEEIVTIVSRDQNAGYGTVVPIVHAKASLLPEAVYMTAQALQPMLLAVPERCLGDGIIARCRMIRRIRSELNRFGDYVPLHLLGTGHPVSLLAYSAAGADSFDGLEWCRQIVDATAGELLPFEYWDFCRRTKSGSVPSEWPWFVEPIVNNLKFYRDFEKRLQTAVTTGGIGEMLREFVTGDVVEDLLEACGRGGVT